MGSIVTEKVGEIEEKTRVGRGRRLRKEVMICIKDVVEKNRFKFILTYWQEK